MPSLGLNELKAKARQKVDQRMTRVWGFYALSPRENCNYMYAEDIYKLIFLYENYTCIFIQISKKAFSKWFS